MEIGYVDLNSLKLRRVPDVKPLLYLQGQKPPTTMGKVHTSGLEQDAEMDHGRDRAEDRARTRTPAGRRFPEAVVEHFTHVIIQATSC